MSAGIGLVLLLPGLPDYRLDYLLFCIALLCARCDCRHLGILLLGVCWGLDTGYRQIAAILPSALEQTPLLAVGEVVGLPEQGVYGMRIRLRLLQPLCTPQPRPQCAPHSRQIQLLWPQTLAIPTALEAGQRWRLPVKLKRPSGWYNPGSFSYQSWLFQQGIDASGYVLASPAAQLLTINPFSLDRQRQLFSAALDRQWFSSLSQSGLLKALILGDKRQISAEQWQWLRTTGTIHLVVVSGLHVGLIAAVSFFLARQICAFFGQQYYRLPWLCAASMAGLYSLMAGFGLPTQRALLMTLIVLVASWRQRYQPMRQVFISTLTLCLLLDPLAPVSSSFWLSFIAVAILLVFCSGRWPAANAAWRAQWVVFIGLMPALLFSYGQLSWVAPIANLWMVPLFCLLIVPASLVLALCGWLLPVSWSLFCWQLLDQLLQWTVYLLQALAAWPMLSITGLHQLWQWLLLLLCVPALLLPTVLRLRLPALLILAVLLLRPVQPEQWRVTVLDVGQGLSVLVQIEGYNLLYDLGADFGEGFHLAGQVVLPTIRSLGVNTVDRLILSHADNDHAGAWAWVLDQLPVTRVDSGEPIPGLASHSCHRQSQWAAAGVVFRYMSLPPEAGSSGNDHSCVLMIEFPQMRLLLAGDIERHREQRLVDYWQQDLHSDVLIVPHHGSISSSSWPWLRRVAPQLAIVSAGYRNRFGHPSPQVVARYHAIGIDLVNTADAGAIILTPEDEHWQWQQWRKTRPRYWLRN